MSDLHRSRRYECRLLDRNAKVITSIWLECCDDTAAIAQAAREADRYLTAGEAAGYDLMEGARRVVFFCA
jgi:hypothetical protein